MLKFVGDINFTDGYFDTGFGVGSLIQKGVNPFGKIQRKKGDLWIGNFECVSSHFSNKQGIHKRQFLISPQEVQTIPHLDIYNVANNHVMQHGPEAYNEMLSVIGRLRADYFGTKQKKSVTFTYQDKIISIVGFNQRPENFSNTPLYWAMPEYSEISKEFEKIRASDVKIAYIHWGNEFIDYPYIDQRMFAHWLVDLGYDLIIGMHPHVLQGYEVYKEKYIFYSIGNFVFNMPWYKTHYSAVISIDCNEDRLKVSYDYVAIGKDYRPSIIKEEYVPIDCRFSYLNSLIRSIPENELYYRKVFRNMKRYRNANYFYILKNICKYKIKDVIGIFMDFIKRKLGKSIV